MNVGELAAVLSVTRSYLSRIQRCKKTLYLKINTIQKAHPEQVKEWERVWGDYLLLIEEERRINQKAGRSTEVILDDIDQLLKRVEDFRREYKDRGFEPYFVIAFDTD